MALEYGIESMLIDDLILKYNNEKINTSPAFQRHSVWKPSDRLRLIDSILANKPIPSIFLYRRNDESGETISDVIDGKQRIETILKYYDSKNIKKLNPIEGRYKDNSEFHEVPKYKNLTNEQKSQFKNYKIAVIQVSGVYEDILNLFININSLGAPLKSYEIRHAKFIQGPWVKYISDFTKKKATNKKLLLINEMFKRDKIIDRMSKEEFILELLLSVFTEEIQDGKSILDKVLSDKSSKLSTKKKNEFIHTLEWMNTIFSLSDLKSSRLKNKTDFYSLFFFLSNYFRKGVVIRDKDPVRNKMAFSHTW